MKVLLVNCVYQSGSTGKIICDLKAGLEQLGCSVIVAIGRGKDQPDNNIHRLCPPLLMSVQSLLSKISGYSYDCSLLSTHNLKRLIVKEKPDVVNLHCVNANTVSIPNIIRWLKNNGIPTVITEHAEFFHTGGCGYSLSCNQWKEGCVKCPQFKTPSSNLPFSFFFDRTGNYWKALKESYQNFSQLIVTTVSPWLANRSNESPFFKNVQVISVFNGLDCSIFKIRQLQSREYSHVFNNKKVVIHVTPDFYSPIKGGDMVLKIANRFLARKKDVVFCIVGYNGDGNDLPSNVFPIKHTRNQIELAELYTRASVTLLTSKRETFSMVTAESLCCGTPVMGFEAGGPESIAIDEFSKFVKPDDIDGAIECLNYFLNYDIDAERLSREAHAIYSKEVMAANYYDVYLNLLKQTKNNVSI